MILDTKRRRSNFTVQPVDEREVHESGKISIATKDRPSTASARIGDDDLQVHGDIALRFRFDEREPIV